ncbi:MAG: hypothetical protein E6J34_07460 [Chloroflexi bacterium]|nr:MAG: hypothetical protein E6J34_07460 [Chloroflexota bacterium]
MKSRSHLLLSGTDQESHQHFLQPHKIRYTRVFFFLAPTLIAGGTVIWVLNILHILPGPWSSIFGAVFAGIGMIITLLNATRELRRP